LWASPLAGAFLALDLAFFGANIVKLTRGGWVPPAIGGGVFLLMSTWNRGTELFRGYLSQADRERHPAATRELDDVGPEEGEVDREERACQRAGPQRRPVPALARNGVEQHGRYRHRSRHGDAVRGTEGVRRFEAENEKQAADHQRCVDLRDINLAHRRPRRVNDGDARAVVKLHALLRQRERAGD